MAAEIMSEAQGILSGGRASLPFSWLEIFDKDDLLKLCSEILTFGPGQDDAAELPPVPVE
jgi:hypothetical protein